MTGTDGAVAFVTRTIDIAPINNPPTISLSRTRTTFMETGGAIVVDPEAVIVDSDAADIRGWTAQITSGYQSGAFGDRLGTSVVVADQRDVRYVVQLHND